MLRGTVTVVTTFLAATGLAFAMGEKLSDEERAKLLHEEVLTLDTHIDIPFNFATEAVDPGTRGKFQFDLPKMAEGGLDAAFFIVFVPQTERTPENYETAKSQALTKFDAIHRMTEELYPDQIELAYSAADARRIYASGKKVAFIGIENGYAIGKDLSLVEDYFQRGARYMSLTHNGHNDLADSSGIMPNLGDEPVEHDGVSALGVQVVEELNRLGIMVDVAHAGKATVLDLAKISKAPIISSHHALRHFVDIPRNLDDEELLAIQSTGGVVQIVAFDTYVKPMADEKEAARKALAKEFGIDSFAAFRALTPEVKAAYMARRNVLDETWPPADVSNYVDHIDYAVNLMGIDHVGISSDFDGGGGITGWRDASQTGAITLELVRRGYSDKDIAKIWGGNLLRVLEEVEKVAKKMQKS